MMTSSGKIYRKDLNLGCGGFYSSDWLGVDNDKDSSLFRLKRPMDNDIFTVFQTNLHLRIII